MGNKHEKLTEFEEHLLNDEKPSIYFRQLADSRLFSDTYPFTLLVVDLAAERRYLSEDPRVFMWSALLHDLGKAHTTKVRRGKITAYDHDKHGAILAADFLKEFTDDEEFIKRVSQMVRWHMQVLFVVKKLPFADIDKMVTEVSLGEIALLSLCDRLGRGDMNEKTKQEEIENIKYFLQKCQQHQDDVRQNTLVSGFFEREDLPSTCR